MAYTVPHTWVVGDFIRASWLNIYTTDLVDHEARLLAAVAAVPKRFSISLGGLESAGVTATSYARIPGAQPFFLKASEWTGMTVTLIVSRYTEDVVSSIRVALCEAANMANIIAESPVSASLTVVDDATTAVTPPGTGIYVVAAAKMSVGGTVGHVAGVSLVGVPS